MSLNTRLDGRSNSNASIKLKDEDGKTLATISIADKTKTTLKVDTLDGMYIEKESGWNSKLKEE